MTCDCHEYQWTGLPCKHIGSVMLTYVPFNDTPQSFQDSVYYTLDKEILGNDDKAS